VLFFARFFFLFSWTRQRPNLGIFLDRFPAVADIFSFWARLSGTGWFLQVIDSPWWLRPLIDPVDLGGGFLPCLFGSR